MRLGGVQISRYWAPSPPSLCSVSLPTRTSPPVFFLLFMIHDILGIDGCRGSSVVPRCRCSSSRVHRQRCRLAPWMAPWDHPDITTLHGAHLTTMSTIIPGIEFFPAGPVRVRVRPGSGGRASSFSIASCSAAIKRTWRASKVAAMRSVVWELQLKMFRLYGVAVSRVRDTCAKRQ